MVKFGGWEVNFIPNGYPQKVTSAINRFNEMVRN